MRFVIITGLSGAGKTQAVRYMEDMGFFCVDNLPPKLIPKFAELCYQTAGNISKVAIVVDIRGGRFFNDLFECLYSLKEYGYTYEILFLDASDDVLIKRFKESRRSHPLVKEGRLIKGIQMEREMLMQLRESANHIIDTSNMLSRELKEELIHLFVEHEQVQGITISVISFGFKRGIPLDADLVFDVRFLPNPFYIDRLKKHSGKDNDVREYIFAFPETGQFLEKLDDMVEYLLPYYVKEGKNQLVIAIGCTGGMHRSVSISDAFFEMLKNKGHRVIIDHRDIELDKTR